MPDLVQSPIADLQPHEHDPTQAGHKPASLLGLPMEIRCMIYTFLFGNHGHVLLTELLKHQERVMERRKEHVRLYVSTPGYARQPSPSKKTRPRLALMRTSKKLYWEISDHIYGALDVYVYIVKYENGVLAGRNLCWSNDCRDLPACVCFSFPFYKIRRLKVVIDHPHDCLLNLDEKYLGEFYRFRARLLEASWLLHLFQMKAISVKFNELCDQDHYVTWQDDISYAAPPGRTDLELILEPLTLFRSVGCLKVRLTETQLDHPKASETIAALEKIMTSSRPVTKPDVKRIEYFHNRFKLNHARVFKSIEGAQPLRAPAVLEGRRKVIVPPLLYRLNYCLDDCMIMDIIWHQAGEQQKPADTCSDAEFVATHGWLFPVSTALKGSDWRSKRHRC